MMKSVLTPAKMEYLELVGEEGAMKETRQLQTCLECDEDFDKNLTATFEL